MPVKVLVVPIVTETEARVVGSEAVGVAFGCWMQLHLRLLIFNAFDW